MNKDLPSTEILGVDITTASKQHVLKYIFKRLHNNKDKFYIVTPNPEILVYASRSRVFRQVLNGATVSLPDGVGVLAAGKILKKRIMGRITGVDMMESMCREASKRHVTVGFLGGRGGVAEQTAECLTKKYLGLIVSFAGEEWPIQNIEDRRSNMEGNQNSKFKIQNSQNIHADILFVAFGFPRQEEWIAKNLSKIDVTCAMGVGGAFDYISGKVKRAPKLIRSIGMEWAFRLIVQPWRLRRQLALPQFIFEIIKERMR